MKKLGSSIILQIALAVVAAPRLTAQYAGTIDLSTDTANVVISGADASDHSGYSLATGDINGDGYLDLVVAATTAVPLPGRLGEYDIVWGMALQQNNAIDLASPVAPVSRIFGEPGSAFFSEVTTGDFNNDGYDDILIGQPYASWEGRAYVVLGSASFPDTVDLVTGSELATTIYGAFYSDGLLGQGICSCDMNGDGYDEIVVSAASMYVGEVYVVQGADSLPDTIAMDGPFPGLTRIIDNKIQHEFGRGLACDDINGDGYDDLAIGAPGAFLDDVGVVSVIYGQAVLPDTIMIGSGGDLQKHVVAENPTDAFGDRVAIGDVNGDGQKDLIVAADGADPFGCFNCGEIYVLHDADSLPDSLTVSTLAYPITRIIGAPTGQHHGHQLHVADISGDGADDIVVSARAHTIPQDRAVIVYGGNLVDSVFLETDTNTTHIFPEVWDDHIGDGIASGDLNQDNIGDLALGADWHDVSGKLNAGRSYVFFGKSSATAVGPTRLPMLFLNNRPNPFSSTTVFEYELDVPSPVTIEVYNILGQRVATISRPRHGPGRFEILWDGSGKSGSKLRSGVYFYRLRTQDRVFTKKVTILR